MICSLIRRRFHLIIISFFLAVIPVLSQSLPTVSGKGPLSARKRFPRIGIFLPLSNNEDGKLKTDNILEFYKGMIAANEYCTSIDSGMTFRLYDHQNSAEQLRYLSESGCLNELDLLVGPVRQNLITVLDSIANTRDIPLINVLSHSPRMDFSGCLFFQQPSFRAISRTCFSKAQDLGAALAAGIVYGTERKDSLLAEQYRQLCLEKGIVVKLFMKVNQLSSEKIADSIRDADLNSKMHLFVVNNEAPNKARVFNAYASSRIRCPVFFYGNWLERAVLDFDDLASMPCYFVAPDLPIPPFDAEWQESYVTRWGSPPSWVAWKGFDLVIMLANQWYSSKTPRFELEKVNQVSEVFGGYLFEPGKAENQFVPLYKFEKTGFTLVNP